MQSALLVILILIASVTLGGLLVVFLKRAENEKIIKLSLAFSGGFLLSIGFVHLIPELYAHSDFNVGVYILLGFLIQLILEFFSGGIEHGHVHLHGPAKVPFGLITALCIHSVLEGIPLGSQLGGYEISTTIEHGDDNMLLYGIVLHQMPVAIALMTLLLASGAGKVKSWFWLMFFAVNTPIGLLIGFYGGAAYANFDFNIVLAVVVGMFLHISTTIIFETSENHRFNFVKLITILAGGSLALLIH